jgi:hypothetical protein
VQVRKEKNRCAILHGKMAANNIWANGGGLMNRREWLGVVAGLGAGALDVLPADAASGGGASVAARKRYLGSIIDEAYLKRHLLSRSNELCVGAGRRGRAQHRRRHQHGQQHDRFHA